MAQDGQGRVGALFRFPVKSMVGEALERAEVDERGLAGDRAYALLDRHDGRVASAKNPRKWATLLRCRAAFLEEPGVGDDPPPVRITLPDGSTVTSDERRVHEVLSALTGRDVQLITAAPEGSAYEEVWPDDVAGLAPDDFIERTAAGREPTGERVSDIATAMAAPPGTLFDLATLHVLTTATLDELGRLAPEADFDVRRYRPNVVVEADGTGFVENDWPGRTLQLGPVSAPVMLATMRCVMTTLGQDGMEADRSSLRAIAAHNRIEIPGLGTWACAGVYAGVATPGPVRVGDPVSLA